MHYMKLILLCLALFFCNTANAKTYYVNTEVLNLRSCAGTDCQILKKLKSGEFVELLEDKGEWVKVRSYNEDGFVIKRYLVAQDTSYATEEIISIILSFISLLIIGITLAWIALHIYMFPARLARYNKNADKIFTANLFMGWIPLIWLILFIVALVGESEVQQEQRNLILRYKNKIHQPD
ncbi:MAG: SH3 domain-containing protein [Alphaproteobacteria bacterium]|nr:SH3 domain-containing protein [Alphaproteobacteria bacterium]